MDSNDLDKVVNDDIEHMKKVCKAQGIPFTEEMKKELRQVALKKTARFNSYVEFKASEKKLMDKLTGEVQKVLANYLDNPKLKK